jgi:hypothetical protein
MIESDPMKSAFYYFPDGSEQRSVIEKTHLMNFTNDQSDERMKKTCELR